MAQRFWRAVKAELQIWKVGAVPGLAVIAAVVLSRSIGFLQPLEWMAFDTLMRFRPTEPTDDRIVIVGINEEDIRRLRTYPIPDGELAKLISTINQAQPAAIGLDIFRDFPIPPGEAALNKIFQTNQRIFVIEKALFQKGDPNVLPPPALSRDQVGFANAILDADGYLRRSLLTMQDVQNPKDYKYSLSIQVAEHYLKTKRNFTLDTSPQGQMQLGSTELTRLTPNSGAYINADVGGDQVFLNFRSGSAPFRTMSMSQVLAKDFDPKSMQGKIVLIGITALSVKDVVNVGAVQSSNPGLVTGVEIQAHAISQIVNAVEEGRPLLKDWSEGWEYVWILGWGIVGMGLGRVLRSPIQILLAVGAGATGIIGIGYGLLILGWWIPVVPAVVGFVMNGAGLAAALFYRHELELRNRLRDREIVLKQAFDVIHNGPLQQLAMMLREVDEHPLSQQELATSLQRLNQDLRAVFRSVPNEVINQPDRLQFNDANIDLQAPLHKILQSVYEATLEQIGDFTGFQSIRVKIVDFQPMSDRHLDTQQKRQLCRFLEEALCNVGKHAVNATKLWVFCGQEDQQQVIRVADNGIGSPRSTSRISTEMGFGTQQARSLEKQLHDGKFRLSSNQPQGAICELRWKTRKQWFV